VATLAVLADRHAAWRPGRFAYDLFGCRVCLEIPVVKLLDYEARWDLLEQSPNPFAVVVMTHLKAQATYRDAAGRLHWKLNLVKMLYRRGYSKADILELFRFIDWLMALPDEMETAFTDTLRAFEEEMKMPYVTSVERRGIQQGLQQGLVQNAREAVVDILEVRFETVSHSIVKTVQEMDDLSMLKILHRKAAKVGTMEEFIRFLEDLLK